MIEEEFKLLSGEDTEAIVSAILTFLRPEMRAIGLPYDQADRMADALDRSVKSALLSSHTPDLRVREIRLSAAWLDR